MRKLLFAAAVVGGFLVAPISAATAASVPDPGAQVAAASGSPPSVLTAVVKAKAAVPTPLPRYRVVSGDSLWSIGIRYHRTWPALAAWNHIQNPDLIFVGDLVTIPPATYTASAPLKPSAPAAPVHVSTRYAPAKQQVSTPVSHTSYYHVPQQSSYSGAPGSYQACVAMRESGNGSGSSNIYGFLQSTWSSLGLSGSPGGASRATQDAAFQRLYAMDGRAPWSPYDGC